MFSLLVLFAARQGLAARIIPHPTGKNGYEEYLRAAEMADGREARRYGNWYPGYKLPPPSPGEPPSDPREVAEYARMGAMAPLDVYREGVAKFGGVLSLVAAGNLKGVYDPHLDLGPNTSFPEYAGFNATTKLAVQAAQVYAADGNTEKAAQVLLNQLRLGDNTGRLIMISNLTSATIQGMVYRAFSDLLPRLSRKDAQLIERESAELLARPPAARSVLNGELQMSVAGLGLFLSGRVSPRSITDTEGTTETAQTLKAIAALPVAARERMMSQVRTRVADHMRAMDRVLAGPERGWISGHIALEEDWSRGPKDEIDTLVDLVTPVIAGPAIATIRARTQLRLLALHARLIEYRWDYGRFPERLNETDPLTGVPYIYEVRPDGTIRLASKGVPETGEIELKSRALTQGKPEVAP